MHCEITETAHGIGAPPVVPALAASPIDRDEAPARQTGQVDAGDESRR